MTTKAQIQDDVKHSVPIEKMEHVANILLNPYADDQLSNDQANQINEYFNQLRKAYSNPPRYWDYAHTTWQIIHDLKVAYLNKK